MDDKGHFAFLSGTGLAVWGVTAENALVFLWIIYVLILIAKNIPATIAQYPFLGRMWASVWRFIRKPRGKGPQ